MLSAALYHSTYLIIVTLLTIFALRYYNQEVINDSDRTTTSRAMLAGIVCVAVILFIGMRPVSGKYFIDMGNYNFSYKRMLGKTFIFDWNEENLFFNNWFNWMASKSIDATLVFVIFAAVYFGMAFIACKKLFPRDTFLAFVVFLAAFSTFSYGTNGLKAGMAASTFLVALAYRDKLWISIPLAVFTFGQHHSMALVIVCYFLVLVVKNPKYYFWGWLFCFMMAALHITSFQTFFAGYTDEHGAIYLLSERNSGFRIDFILYSAVPIFIGYLMIYKYNLIESKIYSTILNLYLSTNGMWMLCMYSSYTNRISYLSWFIYPVVLLYPFTSLNWSPHQFRYLRYAVYGHLGFTLFMSFIYYA